ncbi:hypothetical protein [Halomonas sp. GFAJ-1]|uniref:hypothetical protein n=1 Tax=Halomonas sp. GFAJ-1 TaxID=1118153 RepID=UPI00023A3CAE|nr:hypothetical protein [Halomonas sp. GFAJ-1]AVI63296.1 hypothetical protein BB497_11615 [Halomonas sp. GFAJ-1]EHK62458.1 hypothetical protein MOY_00355 [Halomonas sp. GFAJ-1]
MRVLAIISNVFLLIVVVLLIVDSGWPYELIYQLMLLVFFAAPIISIFALVQSNLAKSESWLGLFMQRKKLEEKEKLRNLQK